MLYAYLCVCVAVKGEAIKECTCTHLMEAHTFLNPYKNKHTQAADKALEALIPPPPKEKPPPEDGAPVEEDGGTAAEKAKAEAAAAAEAKVCVCVYH